MAAQRSAPAPFLTKTYEMVEDVSTDEVISWNESGTTFVVWVPADFAKDLLPIYFKHNNFSSFVRQLNTYGFHKIAPERWEFANEFFRRGKRELLCEIRRRKSITTSRVQNSSGEQSNAGEDLGSGDVDSKAYGCEETTIELSRENEKLRRDNQILSLEITRAKKQCEELIAFLSNHVKVEPDQTNDFVMQEQGWSSHAQLVNDEDCVCGGVDDDDECTNSEEDCLKLFGVCLRRDKLKKKKKKREGDERAGDVVGGPLL